MKALVFNGPADIQYQDYEDPKLTIDNGVIVKVQKCSICGSDLHIYHGDAIDGIEYGAKIEPFCVGHEFIGEVVEVGPAVHNSTVGDRVFVSGGAGCGLPSCRSPRAAVPLADSRDDSLVLSPTKEANHSERGPCQRIPLVEFERGNERLQVVVDGAYPSFS